MWLKEFLLLISLVHFVIGIVTQLYAPQYKDGQLAVNNTPAVKPYAFPLSDVKLLRGSPFL
jgi:hypothetical protein